jgi:pyruvate/2-oxoglutarate dehydrogenase complex dihydrolipoamide dehydrogenase (E3) component
VVIGGGSAGLIVASGAAALGARVAVIEKFNSPASAIADGAAFLKLRDIACAIAKLKKVNASASHSQLIEFRESALQTARAASEFATRSHLTNVLQSGADFYSGSAHFSGRNSVLVSGTRLEFSRAVITTGTIDKSLASEQTFSSLLQLESLPKKLAISGNGAKSAELAQVFARLGVEIQLICDEKEFLADVGGEIANTIKFALKQDGVKFDTRIDPATLTLGIGISVPNVSDLNLETAGVMYDENGIHINDALCTTNRRVFACGGVAGMETPFASQAAARMVIGNALFFASHKFSKLTIPNCIQTDPMIARVGVRENEIESRGLKKILLPVDGGELKIFHDSSGTIMGAVAFHPTADNLISQIVVAMNHHLKLGSFSNDVFLKLSSAESLQQAGDIYRHSLLTPFVSKLIRKFLMWRQ